MAPLSALALACLLGSASALLASTRRSNRTCSTHTMSFHEFVRKYQRGYARGSSEYKQRKKLYEERVRNINDHNCNDELPWSAGINKLTDWTELELKSLRGYKNARTQGQDSLMGRDMYSSFNSRPKQHGLPDSWSWDHLQAIKEPRDQGQCGSCWAFASEQVLRAHAEIKGWPTNFSVAQIISCTPNPRECGGSGGCNGATVELAFDYVLRSGLVTETDLPYSGKESVCPEELKTMPAQPDGVLDLEGREVHLARNADSHYAKGHSIGMLGWTKFPENRVDHMMKGLVEEGPVAVAVAAGPNWNWYEKGIMLPTGCDTKFVISHAVVLFGYGGSGRRRFWHIKNSWGSDWGENGNLRLQRLDHEELYCGWDNEPEVGSGCKGGPAKVWACGSCGILYDTAMPHFSQFSQSGPEAKRF